MVQTCKKLSAGNWIVIVTRSQKIGSISTIRGSFRTRKCALADARRARKLSPGSIVDVVKRVEVPGYLSSRSDSSRKKSCDNDKRKKNCPCSG